MLLHFYIFFNLITTDAQINSKFLRCFLQKIAMLHFGQNLQTIKNFTSPFKRTFFIFYSTQCNASPIYETIKENILKTLSHMYTCLHY
jgi:hypothetical protein